MLFEFTLSELWKMEYPLECYRCPICHFAPTLDDIFMLTHTEQCSLGKALSLAQSEMGGEKGK